VTITRIASHAPTTRRTRLVGRVLGLALVLALGLPPAAPGAAQSTTGQAAISASGGPPKNDPAGPPSHYTLAGSDQLFVLKTQQWPNVQGPAAFGSTYTVKSDLSALSSSTPYVDTGMPATNPAWPLIPVRGRFTDPLHEQALLLDQSNECGGSGCMYTQLLGEPSTTGGAVPTWYNQVENNAGEIPVAVASGDLDGRMINGFPNDEAAVAYLGADGTLQVHVVDYNVAPGQAVDTSPTVTLPTIGTPQAGPGSLAVAVGDFDSDGQNEIAVLWQGTGCSSSAANCLSVPHLSMLRYSNDGQNQSVNVLQPDIPLPSDLMTGSPASNQGLQAAVGDFDGLGTDELAFSFIGVDASLAVLGFAPLDETFGVNRYGRNPGGAGDFSSASYCPTSGCNSIALGSPPQIAAGLFWYDESSGHGLGRRQLAMAALNEWQAGAGGFVSLQLYDVALAQPSCVQSPCPLTLTLLLGPDAGEQGVGPPWPLTNVFVDTPTSPFSPTISLAAGSFQGLMLNPKDQSQVPWPLAVGLSGQITVPGEPQQYVSWITIHRPSGTQPGQFQADELFQTDLDQVATSPRLLAYDQTGSSLLLGAPVVFSFSNHQVPTSILQDPPKHLDWFYDPQQKHGSWLNVDRSESLNLTVTDATTATYESQTTTGSDWTIGASVTTNVTASTEEGLGKIANAGGGLDVSAEVGGQYDKNQSSYNSGGSSNTLSISGATNDDDLLIGSQRSWSVYRYPIIGRMLNDASGHPVLGPDGQGQYGFYEITLPGQTIPFGPGGGRNFGDWYQPLHENGNALSYPALGPDGLVALDPSQLGPPVVLNGSNNGNNPPVTLPQPLINKSYVVDPTGSSVSLQIAQTTGSGNSTSNTGTLSESADIDAGASGGFYVGVAEASGCADVDLKFNNSNSWSSLKTSSNTTTSTNTFTLQQDSAAQPNWAYGAATAYYTDPVGVYRAAHAVNVLASSESQPEWRQYYGGRPDPALNLPDRMVMTYNQKDKTSDIPNFNESDSRQLIRGFFVLHPDANHGGHSDSLQAGAPASYTTDGDAVQLQVRIFNRSLDTPATNVPVRFVAVPRDALDEKNAGPPQDLGTVTVSSISPLGWQPANLIWDTTGKAAVGVQLYRIFVIVAANDPSKGSTDRWNNVIHAWQDRYDDPATVDGTPSGDRLIDPLTAQPETLEAGQNKQGWGEVTIYPKSPAPATVARTSATSLASSPATPVRFGSALQVRAPHGLAASAGGPAATADRVHEVRVNVAADTRGAALLGNSYCHDKDSATLMVYEGDPAHGGSLVGMQNVRALSASGADGRWVTLPWRPRTAGRHQLVARLYDASADPHATPIETTLDVDVAPAAEPPATLGRLLEVLNVVWLPADTRTALAAHLQTANAAVLSGDQTGARTALTFFEQQVDASQKSAISQHSAARLDAIVDALLAAPTLAALPVASEIAAPTRARTLTLEATPTPLADRTSSDVRTPTPARPTDAPSAPAGTSSTPGATRALPRRRRQFGRARTAHARPADAPRRARRHLRRGA
jgi:hypothetical protein